MILLGYTLTAIVIGLIIGLFLDSMLVGFIISGAIFVSGLKYILAMTFIHGEVKYSQDRADLRELDRQYAEDMRHEELMGNLDVSGGDTYNIDARSVHYYGGSNGRIRD